MNIAYIATSGIPSRTANSIHVMKMCQAMVQEGHRPHLVVPYYVELEGSGIAEDVWHYYGITDQFDIARLPTAKRLGRYDFIWKAVDFARRAGCDLLYTRYLPVAVLASTLGLPTVYEAHEPSTGRFSGLLYPLLLRSRHLQMLVVITEALGRVIRERHPQAHSTRMIVAPDGVDLERYADIPEPEAARRSLGLPPERFTVGYTGHLYSGRGINIILQLAARCPDHLFLVVGGNPTDIDKYERKTAQSGLSNVRFAGFVPNGELPAYQAACEILVMPYQERVAAGDGHDIGGFLSPMKLFEYLAVGRLIISSDLPVLKEILNTENAVLCPPDDIGAWQRAVERGEADTVWRESLSRRARLDSRKYTWRNRLRYILDALPTRG